MHLNYLLNKQAHLQKKMGNPMGEGEEALKENALALIVEVTEMLNEINWKPWKETKKEINQEALLYEIVDILQFMGNIINAAGITAEALEDAYRQKLMINTKRIEDGY